jgi:hypothetical protein
MLQGNDLDALIDDVAEDKK